VIRRGGPLCSAMMPPTRMVFPCAPSPVRAPSRARDDGKATRMQLRPNRNPLPDGSTNCARPHAPELIYMLFPGKHPYLASGVGAVSLPRSIAPGATTSLRQMDALNPGLKSVHLYMTSPQWSGARPRRLKSSSELLNVRAAFPQLHRMLFARHFTVTCNRATTQVHQKEVHAHATNT
jgi:hypothetical protein